MFNRTLQVKMVKIDKDPPADPGHYDVTLEGKAAVLGHYSERIIDKIGSAVVSYIVLDTIRQVFVARAKRG